jgi:hypothetical protein
VSYVQHWEKLPFFINKTTVWPLLGLVWNLAANFSGSRREGVDVLPEGIEIGTREFSRSQALPPPLIMNKSIFRAEPWKA